MSNGILRPILTATLVAGTLDIFAAATMTLINGRPVAGMLRTVASGPFPDATEWGSAGAALGLAVHFALMAIMVTIFVMAAKRRPTLRYNPLKWGVLYGVVTYVVMNLIVVPLRWPAAFPPAPMSIATQLGFHILLVGLPVAWLTARHFQNRRAF